MVPYILLYTFIIFFPIWNILFNDKEKYKTLYNTSIFLIILLILGLRHPSMGMDLSGYLPAFHKLNSFSWEKVLSLDSYLNYEKGYIIFNKIIGMITFGNEQIFLFICALISTFPVFFMIHKRSKDILLSWIIYLGLPIFIFQFSGLRQSIAIGLCCSSLKYIEEKKIIKFLLLVLLASCFHYTAWIFIIAYFVYHLRISDKLRWCTLILFPLVYIFRSNLFRMISFLFKEDAVIQETNAGTMMIVFMLIYVFTIILCHGKWNERINGFMNIYFCSCLCMIFSGVFSTAMRIAYYFMLYLVLLLPLALNQFRDKRWSFIFRNIIIVCFIWFAFDSILNTYWAEAYPYYAFWQSMF